MSGNGSVGKLYEHFEPQERFTLTLEALARGDLAEADRLTGSCPRGHYTQRDVRFTERMDTAFDIMVIACIDLRCLWGKLDVLHWVMAVTRATTTHHQVVSTMAFIEGSFHGRGKPQMEFFGKPSGGGDGRGDEDEDEEPEQDHDARDRPRDRLSAVMEGDLARRMAAVEDRAQVPTDWAFDELLRASHEVAGQLAEVWAAFGRFCHSRLGVSAEAMLGAWDFPTGREVAEVLKRYAHVKPDPAKVEEYCGLYCGAWDRRFGEEG